MSKRILASALLAGLLAGTSAAAEPAILMDAHLDSVTAAATAGFTVLARSETSSNLAQSAAGLLNTRGFVDAEAVAVSPDGNAWSRIGGPVLFGGTRNAAVALGLFVGTAASNGDGAATVDATAIAAGDIAVGERIIVPIDQQTSLLLGVGLGIDLPAPRQR